MIGFPPAIAFEYWKPLFIPQLDLLILTEPLAILRHCLSSCVSPMVLRKLIFILCYLVFTYPLNVQAQGLMRIMPEPDGPVRAMTASGDTLFIGGDFRSISKPGFSSHYLGLYDSISKSILGNRLMPDGPVYSILPDNNKGLFIAGQFRAIGDSARYSIAWIDSSGQPQPRLQGFGVGGQINSLARIGDTLYMAGDFKQAGSNLLYTGGFPEFDSSGILLRRLPQPNFPAKVIISDGQGGWIMAGPFTSVEGQIRQGLARIRPDGRLLASWAPAIQGETRALLRVGDTLFVGGTIAALNGQSRGNLAAIRLSTGNPIAWAPACNRPVEALASGNNLLFVGGSFTQIDNSQKGRFAAFNLNNLLPSNLGTSLDSTVRTLLFHNGFLYLGGDFRNAAGLPRRGLAVFDQTFLFPTTANAQMDGAVRSLSVHPSGDLLVGGNFNQAGGSTRKNFAVFDGPLLNLQPGLINLIGRVDWVGAWRGKILIAGSLDSLNNLPINNNLLAFDSLSYQPDSSLLSLPSVPTALAIANGRLTYQSDGKFNGGEAVSHFAAIDLNTGLMLPWKPQSDLPVNCLTNIGRRLFAGGRFVRISMFLSRGLAELSPTTGQVVPGFPTTNGEVRCLAVEDSLLLVGGSFTTIGNQNRTYFSAIQSGSKTLHSLNLSLDGSVSALLSSKNGNLLLGGKFNLINGQNRRGLAQVNLISGQLSAFTVPFNTGTEILAMAEDSSRYYLGGDFVSAGGSARAFLAAIQKNSAVVEPDFLMATAPIRAFAWTNQKLAIGGDALFLGSDVRPGIAAVSISSRQVLPWMPQAAEWLSYSSNGQSRRIETLLLNGNQLLVGGNFNLNSPQSTQHLAAFDLNNGQISANVPQFGAEVRGLTLHNNLVWVVGNFNTLNYLGNPFSRSGIAALNPNNLSLNNWSPAGFPAQLNSVEGLNTTEVIVGGSTIGAFNTSDGTYRSFGFLGGVGRKVAVTGSVVIAGGLFNGSSRFGLQLKLAPNQQNLSVMNLGANSSSLNPLADGVYSVEVGNGLMYAGGQFEEVNGQVQQHLSAFNLFNGNQVAYNPVPDSGVLSLLFHQNTLFVGGRFNQMFGQRAVKLGALRPAFPLYSVNQSLHSSIQVWPNPASTVLHWNLPEHYPTQTPLRLLDLYGRMIQETTLGQQQLSVAGLPSGLYLIQLLGERPQLVKVVIQSP